MKVAMKVGGMDVKYDIHDELYFDPEHVFDVIGKQPGLMTWWASLTVLKDQEYQDAVVKHDRKVAQLDQDIRQLAVREGTKITEGTIKSKILSNLEVEKGLLQLNKLKRDVGFLKAMAKGFESRSVLLATAGSAQKAEIEARLRAMVKGTGNRTKEADI